jgi:aspartate oxidase
MQKANRMYVPEARRGEHNCQAVLTEDNVRFIRQSDMRGVDLAKRFNVTKALISRIRSGKSWKHIL